MPATAQQRRVVRAGSEADTSSWPKPALRAGMSQAETLTALSDLVDRLAAQDRFSGVVLVARDGKPVLERAWGLADREHRVPNTATTKFNLGSINKAFTAIAIRQLAAAGKLSLQDPVRKHLPEFPNPAFDKITIQHLLEMRSGLGHFGSDWDQKPRSRFRTINDYLNLAINESPAFEPGSGQLYSNAGYVLLGAIIERASGQSYYDYVRKNIFAPASMSATESYELDAVIADRATGYTRRDSGGELRANYFMLPARGSSAGGGYSTAGDLLRFALALSAGKIPGANPGGVGVAGGAPGINAILEIDPASGYVIIVLANLDPPAAEYVGRHFRNGLISPEEE